MRILRFRFLCGEEIINGLRCRPRFRAVVAAMLRLKLLANVAPALVRARIILTGISKFAIRAFDKRLGLVVHRTFGRPKPVVEITRR